MQTQLNINNFETYFILGNNPEEKNEKRKVILNVSILFKNSIIVKACENDELKDTICYSTLLKYISGKLESAQFNLIERATQFLYGLIKDYVHEKFSENKIDKKNILIRVEVIKPNPMKNLESASFVCSDW